MNARKLLTVLVVATLCTQLAIAPAAAAPFGDDTPTPDVVKSDGHPTFVVNIGDSDDLSKLEDWAQDTNDRAIISTSADGNVATIRAPWDEVMHRSFFDRLLNGPALAGHGYVQSVTPNYELEYAEPVQASAFPNATDLSKPTVGVTSLNDPARPTKGIAAKGDTEPTSMAESRQILGVDNVSTDINGSAVTVAVIDTGVNTAGGSLFGANESSSSPDRVLNASKNFITNETVAETGYDAVEDGNGHGTWVASSIAANATNDTHDGVAPEASVLALKALDDDGGGSTSNIAAAIRYAADHDADVITMSLGSPVYSPALQDAIKYAKNNGVKAITVAVGNSRQTTRWMATPSDMEGVISVAATNGTTPGQAGSAYFSQLGPDPSTTDGEGMQSAGEQPDIAAPGMTTVALTADTSGFTSNTTLSGTSMATPMVAGTIVLGIDAHPAWDAAKLRKWVLESARPIPNAAKVEVGHGMAAADRLINTTAGSIDQSSAMADGAVARAEYYRALSNAAGGFWTNVLSGGGVL